MGNASHDYPLSTATGSSRTRLFTRSFWSLPSALYGSGRVDDVAAIHGGDIVAGRLVSDEARSGAAPQGDGEHERQGDLAGEHPS
jgi:hypothetical protein